MTIRSKRMNRCGNRNKWKMAEWFSRNEDQVPIGAKQQMLEAIGMSWIKFNVPPEMNIETDVLGSPLFHGGKFDILLYPWGCTRDIRTVLCLTWGNSVAEPAYCCLALGLQSSKPRATELLGTRSHSPQLSKTQFFLKNSSLYKSLRLVFLLLWIPAGYSAIEGELKFWIVLCVP